MIILWQKQVEAYKIGDFLKHGINDYRMCSVYFFGEKNLTDNQNWILLELHVPYTQRTFQA